MSSILTNTSAMVALQTLKSTNKNLGQVQNQIATGLKVSTAKDNAASWSIGQTLRSDIGAYSRLSDSLTSTSAVVGTARTAAEQIAEKMVEIQEKVVQGQNESADGKAKLDDEITAIINTISSIAESAQINGQSLVSSTGADIEAVVSITRSNANPSVLGTETLTVAAADLSDVGDGLSTASTLDEVEVQLQRAITAAATFGADQIRLDAQKDFLDKQVSSLKTSLGATVDADMEEASARLQALQTQQQLGIQALSIANQAPQSVLSLFR